MSVQGAPSEPGRTRSGEAPKEGDLTTRREEGGWVMTFFMRNNTTIELVQSLNVIGWGYAQQETVNGVVGQTQRWVLKPGYVAPPAGTVKFRQTDPLHSYTTLSAWTSAVGQTEAAGGIWGGTNYAYVKAFCVAYAQPTVALTAYPKIPSLQGIMLDSESADEAPQAGAGTSAEVADAGGYSVRFEGTIGSSPVDVLASIVQPGGNGGTKRIAQFDTGPAQVTQSTRLARVYTEAVTLASRKLDTSYEHWALPAAWDSPNTTAATAANSPSTEQPTSLDEWIAIVKPGGVWPTGSQYVIAGCRYWRGLLPSNL